MTLPVHVLLLATIAAIALLVCRLCRRNPARSRTMRLALGYGIAVNEAVWWVFRYWHEGIRASNLPLQLCDVTLWATVIACIVPFPLLVEFAYFAGLAGAGMALLTPDLWSPWPSYPAIYFFVAHGGIVIAVAVLVFGRICPLRRGAMWRAFALLAGYTALVGAFNALFRTNYMYLCQKPGGGSLLDLLGPWPVYLFGGAAAALALFALLSIPVRRPAHEAGN
ncbi:MAG: TIGR02206 family membrane protein [Bryobacteraceae bacterium]|jgi:hypothetical integral membrane protein (TIGR02206 family)